MTVSDFQFVKDCSTIFNSPGYLISPKEEETVGEAYKLSFEDEPC
jgi:hypothetical protein